MWINLGINHGFTPLLLELPCFFEGIQIFLINNLKTTLSLNYNGFARLHYIIPSIYIQSFDNKT